MADGTSNRIFSKGTQEIFFYSIFAIAAIIVMWNLFSHVLSPFFMQIQIAIVKGLYHFYAFFYELLGGSLDPSTIKSSSWLGKYIYGLGLGVQKYQNAINSGYVFTFVELVKAFYHFSFYLWWWYLVIFIALGYWYSLKSEAKYFTTNHSMKSLILQERVLYPEIYPVSELDLINSSDTTGFYASPLTAQEFAERYDLFMDSKSADSKYRDAFGQEFRRLDKAKAKAQLDKQLSERFQGFDKMSRIRQVIFAILGVGLLDNTKSTNYKLTYCVPKAREIAKQYYINGNKFDMNMAGKWVEEYYEMFCNDKNFNDFVLNRHAYELTMFMTMLNGFYKQQGVINPTSLFWWLRKEDPLLFLALNYVGHQNSTFSEPAGFVSHWIVETRLGMPLIGKRTEAAVDALERELYRFSKEGMNEAIFKPS